MNNLDHQYIYVFFRTDVPVRQQMLAGLHAMERLKHWLHYGDGTPNVVMLQVANEAELKEALEHSAIHCLPLTPWRDPDESQHSLRALAVGPLQNEDRKWLKKYRLYGNGAQSPVA